MKEFAREKISFEIFRLYKEKLNHKNLRYPRFILIINKIIFSKKIFKNKKSIEIDIFLFFFFFRHRALCLSFVIV